MRIPIAAGVSFSVLALLSGVAVTSGAVPPEPGLAAQLRYIGRDERTGMTEPIAERGIFAIEQGFATYNEATREPVPPPPVEGLDVASIAAPAIGLDASVKRYGRDRANRLDVPQDNTTVGWNPGDTALPGTGESTFFAAHFVYGGTPGVFYRLSELVAGDVVAVTLSDGSVLEYQVTSTIDYALEAIDMGAILRGREGVESITLMTCSGPGDATGFPLRTVVLAERIP